MKNILIKVKPVNGRWVLYAVVITTDDKNIYKVLARGRLYSVIEAASVLHMHIDNESELPLKQWGKL